MPKRHAFLFLVHNQPNQVSRLIRALDDPAFDTYVHVDADSPHDFESVITSTRLIRKHHISWGGMAMVTATLELLQIATTTESYHTFTLLSGADYPIKPIDRIKETLDKLSRNRLECWKNRVPRRHSRYRRYFFNDIPGFTGRVFNGLSRRLAKILPPRSFINDLEPHFGSQWWTLTENGARTALEFARKRPDFVRFCRTVHIPDELFFQTALFNTLGKDAIISDPLRYLDWTEERAHPKTLLLEDLDALQSSDALFARKFVEGQSEPLIEALNTRELTSN